jgi:hypothetical protein
VIFEGMDVGAGVAASVLGIPAAAYAIALASLSIARCIQPRSATNGRCGGSATARHLRATACWAPR